MAPESWRRAIVSLAAGAILLLGAGLAKAEEMLEIGAPPVIVHAAPENARLAADLARRGQADVPRIAAALGVDAPRRIDAWLLPRRGSATPESVGLPAGPSWASGLALSDRPVLILRTDEERGDAGNEVATTLTHELVHAIMLDALRGVPARIPAWWTEGVAAHLASEWRLVQGAHVVGLAMTGSFVPLSDLEDGFPPSGSRVQWAYLESFAFLRWLEERSGPDAIGVVHRRLLEGDSFRAAFIAAFGESPARLEEEWKGQFLWRYRWIPVLTSSSTVWGVVMIAFVMAGIRKRREAARRLEAWEDEPDELASLPDELASSPDESPSLPDESPDAVDEAFVDDVEPMEGPGEPRGR